ncbi:MAG: hypothetical protein KA184_03045 [Candidatus Hydrogenedentes bacterium]|nr:hypothetical protein [Candidatus Hydrogenedentota bacterium]
MSNWTGFVAWFDDWCSDVVDGLVDRGTGLLSSLPLFQVIEFILALFGRTITI